MVQPICEAFTWSGPILTPGEHRIVGIFAADEPQGGGIQVPLGVDVLSTRTGVTSRISEDELTCNVKVFGALYGPTTETLQGCTMSLEASGTAYRTIFAGHARDQTHDIQWSSPAGETIVVNTFEGNAGPAGRWDLTVPIYLSPAGSHYADTVIGAPLPPDWGVFGAFADIPSNGRN